MSVYVSPEVIDALLDAFPISIDGIEDLPTLHARQANRKMILWLARMSAPAGHPPTFKETLYLPQTTKDPRGNHAGRSTRSG